MLFSQFVQFGVAAGMLILNHEPIAHGLTGAGKNTLYANTHQHCGE